MLESTVNFSKKKSQEKHPFPTRATPVLKPGTHLTGGEKNSPKQPVKSGWFDRFSLFLATKGG